MIECSAAGPGAHGLTLALSTKPTTFTLQDCVSYRRASLLPASQAREFGASPWRGEGLCSGAKENPTEAGH
jgi:hypothetical protein